MTLCWLHNMIEEGGTCDLSTYVEDEEEEKRHNDSSSRGSIEGQNQRKSGAPNLWTAIPKQPDAPATGGKYLI